MMTLTLSMKFCMRFCPLYHLCRNWTILGSLFLEIVCFRKKPIVLPVRFLFTYIQLISGSVVCKQRIRNVVLMFAKCKLTHFYFCYDLTFHKIRRTNLMYGLIILCIYCLIPIRGRRVISTFTSFPSKFTHLVGKPII